MVISLFLRISLEKRGCLIIRDFLYSGQYGMYVPECAGGEILYLQHLDSLEEVGPGMCAQMQRQSLQVALKLLGMWSTGPSIKDIFQRGFLYLLPHLDHSVPLSPVSKKAHIIPVHSTPFSRVTINVLVLIE